VCGDDNQAYKSTAERIAVFLLQLLLRIKQRAAVYLPAVRVDRPTDRPEAGKAKPTIRTTIRNVPESA